MDKRIGIYLRVSTQGQSTELQRVEIEQYLKARGWHNCFFYEDTQTGTNSIRPALRRLLKDTRSRSIDIVIVWKLDRFFRSLRDMILVLQEFKELGVDFVSLRDQIDLTTASGRLMLHLLSSFSEFEAALIKERINAGISNAKRKGVRLGRPPSISSAEVKRLRESGASLSEIAKAMGTTKSGVSKSLKKSRLQLLENTSAINHEKEVSKTIVSSTTEMVNKGVKHD